MNTWLANALGDGPWTYPTAFLLEIGLKGTTLLLLAASLAMLLRKRAAATRHWCWQMGLFGLLLLPMVTLALPRWQWDLLPSPQHSVEFIPEMEPLPPSRTDAPPAASNRVATADETPRPLSPVQPLRIDASQPTPTHNEPLLPGDLFLTWFVGFLGFTAYAVSGHFHLRRLPRRAAPESIANMGSSIARQLAIKQTVSLQLGPTGTMPMAAGLLRPIVFLPQDATDWSESRLRAVLLHELAHVKRRDCLTHAVASQAVALHWFNPLAWWALRQLRIEREHACDDLVLTAGEAPENYANHLLEIARTMRTRRLTGAAAITMARKSQLEGRLLAVLDGARNRSALGWGAALVLGTVGLGLVIMLSPIEITDAKGVQPPVAIVGNWQAQGANVYVGEHNFHVPLELQIDANGRVQGRLGDAVLEEAVLSEYRKASRLLPFAGSNVDYIIEGQLRGQLNELDYDGPVTIEITANIDHWFARPFLSLPALGQNREGKTHLGHYRMETQGSPYTLLFSHDIRASLVGICAPHADQVVYWEPDGVPLPAEPAGYDTGGTSITPVDDKVARQFYLSFTNFAPTGIHTDYNVTWALTGASSSAAGGFGGDDHKRIHILADQPGDQTGTTLRIGIAAGPWHTAVSSGFGSASGSTSEGSKYNVVVSEALHRDGETVVLVTHEKMEHDLRMVAIDNDGNAHVLPSYGRNGVAGLVQARFGVSPLNPEDIDHLEFQVRDYVWREFPEIALVPGRKSGAPNTPHQAPFPEAKFVITNGDQQSPGRDEHPLGPSDGYATFGKNFAVSEVNWRYLGRAPEGWRFKFHRRFPADQPDIAKNVAREVVFTGEALRIFEDAYQWVGIEPGLPDPAPAALRLDAD